MDDSVRLAVAEHEDYQRLQKVFPLEFLLDCMTNPRRHMHGGIRMWGNILRQYASNPTLFIDGVRYHELAELEWFRNRGYSDEQLGQNHSEDPNFGIADMEAKRKELKFYQFVCERVLDAKPPFLSWTFSSLAAMKDLGVRMPGSYDEVYRAIEARGLDFYKDPFTLRDVEDAIVLLKKGGSQCSGEKDVLVYAQRFLSGERPVQAWELS